MWYTFTMDILEKKQTPRRRIAVFAAVLFVLLLGVLIVIRSRQPVVVEPEEEVEPPACVMEDPVEEPVEPKVREKVIHNPQLAAAYAENNDVVGWLSIPECEIDNRVFQYTDNDYYLRKDEQGNYDVWGCYFLDYINVQDGFDFTDRVNIIYGHAHGDTSENPKFSKLKRFRDEEFSREHPTIRFDLLYQEWEWEIFACSNVSIYSDFIDPNPEGEKWHGTFDSMIENSFVDYGVSVTEDDTILLLSTCTSNPEVRFVVAAKLIREEGTDGH